MHVLLAALLAAAPVVEAPVTDVTVYSDRARVTRTARVPLSGTQQVALPHLLETVDPATIRVEATGGEVLRVDIQRLQPDALPVDEARRLLEDLNRVDDALTRARSEQAAFERQAAALAQITPTVPEGDPLKPPPRLESSGWQVALSFVSDALFRVQERSRALTVRIEDLERERQQLVEKAQLLGGAARRGGYRVVPTVSGSGTAQVRITYLAGPARWYPTYDLQLAPEKGKVQVAFAGLVSQETGEDWADAKLVLSTAEPATVTRLPELQSWKLGERDRFIPTPAPKPQYLRPAPAAPALPRAASESELLRQRLYAVAGHPPTAEQQPPQRPRPARNQKRSSYAAPQQDSAAQLGAPAYAPPPVAMEEADDRDYESMAAVETTASKSRGSVFNFQSAPVQTSAFSLAPPPGYRPPQYSADLPAALAGGYDLSFPSLQKETIASGKGARRVALFAQAWPVQVERKLFPALAKEAYLVAELKSPSPTPLPGGNAFLYVGADPAGTARLDLVAPGEAFTLPLGLDRALKPIRNVELVTAEQGLIGKDDVNRYVVRTELANPYAFPVKVKIFDQWPLSDDDDVEVKLLETKPWAIQDAAKGSLEWHLTLQPNSKTTVSFSYSIRRPKNWRLHQRN